MEKYFCNYNQSLALKELGFKKPCFGWYEHSGNFYYCYQEGLVPPSPSKKLIKNCCLAPLKSQVFEWVREKHNLYHEIRTFAWEYYKKELGFSIGTYLNPIDIETERLIHPEVYETYEEAESACIDKLIEIVKKEIV